LTSEREGKRTVWDLAICAAVVICLSSVWLLNMDSPVFGLLLIHSAVLTMKQVELEIGL
jgi:hypothetical protein